MAKKVRGAFAAAFVFLSFGLTTQAFCESPTFQMEEDACQDDALRLCGPEIPDHAKILGCLQYYEKNISVACRTLVMPKGKERRE